MHVSHMRFFTWTLPSRNGLWERGNLYSPLIVAGLDHRTSRLAAFLWRSPAAFERPATEKHPQGFHSRFFLSHLVKYTGRPGPVAFSVSVRLAHLKAMRHNLPISFHPLRRAR